MRTQHRVGEARTMVADHGTRVGEDSYGLCRGLVATVYVDLATSGGAECGNELLLDTCLDRWMDSWGITRCTSRTLHASASISTPGTKTRPLPLRAMRTTARLSMPLSMRDPVEDPAAAAAEASPATWLASVGKGHARRPR